MSYAYAIDEPFDEEIERTLTPIRVGMSFGWIVEGSLGCGIILHLLDDIGHFPRKNPKEYADEWNPAWRTWREFIYE